METENIGPVQSEPIGRNFKLMSMQTALARTGTSAFSISIVWIALTLTNSTVAAGFADSIFSLPLFFSFAFGAYIDKMGSKRNLSVISSLARTASILLLFIPIFYDSFLIRIIAIYSVSFALGMTSDILNSIRSSWSKQFLSEAQYKKGTSLLETATSMAQSAGYAISGVLLSFGLVTTIYTLIVIFLVSTVPLVAIRDSTQDKTADNGSLGRSMAEGIRYIRNSGALKAIITITLFVNLAFGSVGIFFAYLVDFVFRLSAVFYGLMFLSLTIGLILGSALGSAIRGKLGFYNTIFIFVIGIMMVSMGFADIIYLDFFVVFIIGLLVGQVNVISQTGVLKIVSQDMIARVYGAFSTFALGITFLSGGIGGILIDLLTLRWSFVLIGGIISLVAVLSVVSREYYNLSV